MENLETSLVGFDQNNTENVSDSKPIRVGKCGGNAHSPDEELRIFYGMEGKITCVRNC